MKNKQNFIDKFFAVISILGILKLIEILSKLIDLSFKDVVLEILIFIAVMFFVLAFISLFKNNKYNNSNFSSTYNNTVRINNSYFDQIKNKYEQIAKSYIKSKEYKKAAKVYTNLLNNNYLAAEILKEGKLYNEAAAVYLRLLQDKKSAAECYVKAHQYHSAIDLYRELEEYEKVGDLYLLIYDDKNAAIHYQIVIDKYIQNDQFVKASLIYSKKMNDCESAQKILFDGWGKNLDAYNCLITYVNNFTDNLKLEKEIEYLYSSVLPNQKLIFLKVLKRLFTKNSELQLFIKNIAYEIIADKINSHPQIAKELKYFNPQDRIIEKDITRFRTGNNRVFTG